MNTPEELKYTKDHEWIKINGDTATIGITDFAQSELGDIVFIEVEAVGKELKAGEVFGTIEAVKTVSDLYLPLSGTVTEINNGLENEPESVNQDPYGNGWIIKMKLSDPSEASTLLNADAYNDITA